MDNKVVLLLCALGAVSLLAPAHAHNHNRHAPHAARPARHVKRHLEEFLEPPPPPPPGRGAASLAAVIRSRRGPPPPGGPVGPGGPGGPAGPDSTPSMSLGERIARWFYAGPGDGAKQHGNKGGLAPPVETPTMVGLSPPPPPPPQQPQSPVGPQHSPPPPHTAEAAALTEQKPPPPQQLQQQPQQNQQADQHASGTEHHAQGYQGGGGGGGGGYPHAQNYPVLLPQSYLRTTDCNPCNNVPWIPMSRAQAGVGPAAPQDSYGPPAAGEAWGQASDAVPLAQAPIPFPSLHKGPLPPIFQADDFTRVQPDPPTQPVGLHDHLVPPTPEHDSVVFTINEEHNEQPVVEANNEVGDGVGELKSAPGDQLHQGTLQYNVGHGVDYSGGQNGGHGGAHNGGHNGGQNGGHSNGGHNSGGHSGGHNGGHNSGHHVSHHVQHQHALAQHQVSGLSQHHVPHLAHHNAPVIHHVPPPLNSVHQQPYSASAAKGALGGGVELVQSVPIASYLASIEYPMTFIQSPLIEIPVKSVPVPHGFVQPQPQHQSLPQPIPLPLPVPQPQPQLQAQHQAYQIVAPTPLSDGQGQGHASEALQTHAGSLPLQGESQHGARLADSAPASSASIQHHNYPPCRHYAAAMAAAAAAGHGNDVLGHHHHEDAATANSQNSHAYAQELGHFESQRVTATPAASPTAAAAPNNYRLLEDGAASSAWPSTSEAPPTSSWDASAAATVTANGASGYSAPSGPSASGPSAPAGKGGKKTKQIQIIVPYTIDKESGQVRLHSELMPEELSGVGAESEGILSYTPPPDLPPSAAGALPSGLEALVQQTARKVPQSVVQEHQQHQQHQQPQGQESVVVAELSPTPWQAGAAGPHDKGAAPSPTDPFAGLQHILATDLRTLLRNEEDSVDRLRLQKNIDNWTAQEWSSLKATRDTEAQEANPGVVTFNFTSTTASVGTSPSASSSLTSSASSVHGKLNPSKKIPKEYLTTTPLSVSSAPTTPRPTSTSTAARRKEASEATKRPAKIHPVRKNATRDERRTKNGWTLVDNLVVPGPTTTTTSTSAPPPRSTPAPATPDNHRPADQTRAPWERLQVSISPLTREKVYVVTPLTTSAGEPTTESTSPSSSAGTTASDSDSVASKSVNINDLSPFRKWMDVPSTTPGPGSVSAAPAAASSTQHTRPRFSIRPTPGWPKPRPHGFRSTPTTAAPASGPTAPTAERLAGAETTATPAAERGAVKASRATPRGFAVETISGHSKVFTATTSTWSKKKAVDSDTKKSTTAKPTTVSGSRTTRALKPSDSSDDAVETVTATPDAINHHVDLSDIDAEASASVLHHHVAQLSPLAAAILKASASAAVSTTTPTTPAAEIVPTTAAVAGPEIVIVEGRREMTTLPTTAAETTEASPTTTGAPTVEVDASSTTPSPGVTATVTEATSLRTTRAVKTIGRRPDGSRYILSDEEAKQQNSLSAQRTKLQAVTTPKKYESPPPRPKPHKQSAATDALFRRKPSRRPPHLVMTPDRGSYLWNFSEFSGTSHEDMVEDDVSAIKGAVVELKKESTPVSSPTSTGTSTATPTETTTPTTGLATSAATSASTTPPSSSTEPAAVSA